MHSWSIGARHFRTVGPSVPGTFGPAPFRTGTDRAAPGETSGERDGGLAPHPSGYDDDVSDNVRPDPPSSATSDPTRLDLTIAIVTDGSPDSDVATRVARRIVGPDPHWIVATIVPPHPKYTSGATGFAGPVLTPDEMDEQATADLVRGDAMVASTARAFGADPVEHVVVHGHDEGAIDDLCRDRGVDLVVVSSEFDGPVHPDHLAGHIAAPVLIVPAAIDPGDDPGDADLDDLGVHVDRDGGMTVLIAIDDSALDRRIVDRTRSILEGHTTSPSTSATVRYVAVHVLARRAAVMPVTLGMNGAADAMTLSALSSAYGDGQEPGDLAVAAARAAGLEAAEAVGGRGDPAEVIAAAADRYDVDLIVVGTHERSWFSHLLRPSVSDAVTDHAHRPVLVIA